MKKSEILEATTQYLIIKLMQFAGWPTITKQDQKQFFWIVDELIKRKVIKNDMDFISYLKGYLRSDCIPEKYKSLFN